MFVIEVLQSTCALLWFSRNRWNRWNRGLLSYVRLRLAHYFLYVLGGIDLLCALVQVGLAYGWSVGYFLVRSDIGMLL